MAKNFRAGQSAPRSGVYTIVGPHGGSAGKEYTVVRGKPLPPTPKHGQVYKKVADVVVTKSGKFIIAPPAKSANTVASWSKAFSKK